MLYLPGFCHTYIMKSETVRSLVVLASVAMVGAFVLAFREPRTYGKTYINLTIGTVLIAGASAILYQIGNITADNRQVAAAPSRKQSVTDRTDYDDGLG